MPNLKIYIDTASGARIQSQLAAALPSLRDLLCRHFEVDASLCQFAIIAVSGLKDQAQLSIEIALLPKPTRTRERILTACGELRAALMELIQMKAAVRVTTVDPEGYLVLR